MIRKLVAKYPARPNRFVAELEVVGMMSAEQMREHARKMRVLDRQAQQERKGQQK